MVTTDACLIVRAPHWTPARDIERFVEQKQNWITQKQEFFRKRPFQPKKQFINGEEFSFLGQVYPLCVAADLPKAVVLADGALMIAQVAVANAADHVRHWYEKQALEYISQRVEYYSRLTNLSYKSVKVSNARTRWGSCSHAGGLNFNWRLIMASVRVIDYVVAHELMHLRQMNHSRRFWAEVAAVVPDYKQEERWLKQNGHLLHWKD